MAQKVVEQVVEQVTCRPGLGWLSFGQATLPSQAEPRGSPSLCAFSALAYIPVEPDTVEPPSLRIRGGQESQTCLTEISGIWWDLHTQF